ncbi:MAG: hypothetical protein IPH76_17955 [Xanthomonadales bacterium]|nr:hypothetical protein [Xanthomonadales bacterium]
MRPCRFASRWPAATRTGSRALSTELWPERLRQFPNHPDTHALAEAEALLVLGQRDAAQARLLAIKARIDARETPHPAGWSSTSYYFYYPCDLPGMLGDLDGVRAAERDWTANAPRDVWAESGIRLAFASRLRTRRRRRARP